MKGWRNIVAIGSRFLHASGTVRILLGNRFPCYQRFRINPLCALPIRVFVSEGVRLAVVVAVLEIAVSVIHTLFLCLEGTGEVEFAD